MSWCLMNKVTIDLTGGASLSVSDSVRDHLRPVVSESSKSIAKLRTKLVSSARTVIRVFEVDRQASDQAGKLYTYCSELP